VAGETNNLKYKLYLDIIIPPEYHSLELWVIITIASLSVTTLLGLVYAVIITIKFKKSLDYDKIWDHANGKK